MASLLDHMVNYTCLAKISSTRFQTNHITTVRVILLLDHFPKISRLNPNFAIRIRHNPNNTFWISAFLFCTVKILLFIQPGIWIRFLYMFELLPYQIIQKHVTQFHFLWKFSLFASVTFGSFNKHMFTQMFPTLPSTYRNCVINSCVGYVSVMYAVY